MIIEELMREKYLADGYRFCLSYAVHHTKLLNYTGDTEGREKKSRIY